MHFDNAAIEFIILFIFVATLVGLLTRRLRLPYTVGLVLMGLVMGVISQPGIRFLPSTVTDLIHQAEINITPNIILGVLVTPLVFEAAVRLNWREVRRDLPLLVVLAVPGVVLTMLLVGYLFHFGTGFSLAEALVFGALISATDPVSVVAVFRSIGVPRRLQLLLEGESLFNDGTAIVIFMLAVDFALGNFSSNLAVAAVQAVLGFIKTAGGGLAVGMALGWLFARLISTIDDHLIETTLTVVLAFSAYLLAERFEVSGILSVVAAGIMLGNQGQKSMSPTTTLAVNNFWDNAAFISNSIVFLLIGLEVNLAQVIYHWRPALFAIFAVLLARAVMIYGVTWFSRDIPLRWRHVLFWGGLRGALSLTLAMTLPLLLGPESGDPLKTIAFSVVLFTILVQGFSMQPLVSRLKLVQRTDIQQEYERRHARAVAARAAQNQLEQLYAQGLISHFTWESLASNMQQHTQALAEAARQVIQDNPWVGADEYEAVRRETLHAQRSAILGLLNEGVISDEIYSQVKGEIDMALSDESPNRSNLANSQRSGPPAIECLLFAVVQINDAESSIQALTHAGLSVTRLASTGGFLGRRNVTLMVGMAEAQRAEAIGLLARTCHQRTEYIATPLEGAPFPVPLTTAVTVGGATIFTLKVERYEEIL